jgi:hypothetical protein
MSEKNMENTESHGKHRVRRKIWKTQSTTYCQREIWKTVIKLYNLCKYKLEVTIARQVLPYDQSHGD